MCGRTACTLAPDDLCKSCGYMNKLGKWTEPEWQSPPGGQKYYQSHNVAPGSHTPILLSKSYFTNSDDQTETEKTMTVEESETTSAAKVESEEGTPAPASDDVASSDWVIQPMHWGLVPRWHHGEAKAVGYSMINARSDGLLSKRTYKTLLDRGQRCVVLIDGYFEWQAAEGDSKGKKQPYFIYFPPAPVSKVEEVNKAIQEAGQETAQNWTGKRVLTLAGLFEKWTSKEGEALYSYSIITVDAHKDMSQIHDRMPAILDGEEEVRAWLDAGKTPTSEAMKLIRPYGQLQRHPVSSCVGDVKNKSEDCVKPVDLKKEAAKTQASQNFMKTWLTQGTKRPKKEAQDSDEPDASDPDSKKDSEESPTKKLKSEKD